MHSKIFQVGLKPITIDEYVFPEEFYDNSSDFADYIGNSMEGKDRKECVEYLAESLDEIFDFDGEALIYKGMNNFLSKWVEKIKSLANELTEENIFQDMRLWYLSSTTKRTHLHSNYRFFIEDWNGCADPLSELIEFVAHKMKVGDKLYVGNVIDYHF